MKAVPRFGRETMVRGRGDGFPTASTGGFAPATDDLGELPRSQTESSLAWRWHRSPARDNRTLFGHGHGGEGAVWIAKQGFTRDERAVIERCIEAGDLDARLPTLEAATGGGRLVRALQERGFTDLTGFDVAPESVRAASRADGLGRVRFAVADATRLPYRTASFAQAVYLQQLLSILETAEQRSATIREAYRVLVPGGVALVSVLCFDDRGGTRLRAAAVSLYTSHLRLLRFVSGREISPQLQPWPGVNGVLGMLLDWAPYAYWFRDDEIHALLHETGFAVERVLTAGASPIRYFVCRKQRLALAE